MTTRGQYLRNKQTHSQRAWPELDKKPMAKPDEDTVWVGPFVAKLREAIPTGMPIDLESPVVQELGTTPGARESKLRKLSSMGVLSMNVNRGPQGSFLNYYWEVMV